MLLDYVYMGALRGLGGPKGAKSSGRKSIYDKYLQHPEYT